MRTASGYSFHNRSTDDNDDLYSDGFVMCSSLPPTLWQRHPGLVAAALVAGILTVALTAFTPRYTVNDDVMMTLIAAGRAVTDVPDDHLVFTNALVGRTLRDLYRLAPEVPWYGVYLLGVTALSVLALSYAFLRANPCGRQVWLTTAFLAAFALPALTRPQFTVAAFTASLAGLTLLLVAALGKVGRAAWAAGPALLVLGCLVRFDACLLACAVFAPALAAGFLGSARGVKRRALAAVVAGAVVLGLGAECLSAWYYESGPGWQGFYGFNGLRARFTDYGHVPLGPGARASLAAAGWSESDLRMLVAWSFADPDRYGPARLHAALEAAPWSPTTRDARGLVLTLTADPALHALLAVGAACWLVTGGGRRAGAIPLYCLLCAVGAATLLYFFRHLPQRVYFPAFAAFPVAALVFAPGRLPARRRSVALAVGLALAFLALRTQRDLKAETFRRERHTQAKDLMARLAAPDRLFVLWAEDFPLEHVVLPLERLGIPADFKAVSFGWTTRTPLTERRLSEFGVTDLYAALYRHDGVFLVARPARLDLLKAYLKEHYGARPECRVVLEHPALGNARVFKLSAPPPPDPDDNQRRGAGAVSTGARDGR